ncbi:TonB-dependent receptor [Ignavibacterium sp.]|uniref:TonB-dependent receptor n=1 Tax=Ignavibacterium sp. TaxID=2651167 RepID=UPI00307F9F8B
MKRISYRIILLAFFFISLQISILAQSGKISGKVIDGTTNEGIPFVNIIVEGTNYGAASDIEGNYNIIGVPPGTYNVKSSAIGYNPQTVQGVKVSIDLTTQVNFTLYETSIELKEEVVVVATRPPVTKDLTSSTSIIGADEISVLPVTEFQEVLNLKAGIVGGSVRGGRKGEVVYAIDGVPVTDVYDGSTVVDVNANSIQELQFISGAFNAEYGRALSGYVNIATKDGDNKFNGTFTTYVGDYYSTNDKIFRDIKNFQPVNIRNFEGSFSGPIIQNSLFFYLNARYIYFGGWLDGKRVFNPWNITENRGASFPLSERYILSVNPDSGLGDGKIVPMNWNEKIYGQGKLTYRMFTNFKVNYSFFIDKVDYQDYDHSFAYNPDGDYKKFRKGYTNILGFTHTLTPNSFHTLNFTYFFKSFKQYVYEDPNDRRYTHDVLLSQQPAEVPSFRTGGTQAGNFKRLTNTYGVKWDFTSQVDKINLVKFGVEFNYHNLGFDDIFLMQPLNAEDPRVTRNPFVRRHIPDQNDPNENLSINRYIRKPIELSAYIQDKIELNEMIINVGLRMDYFKPDGKLLVDPTDPDVYRPKKPENIALTLEERKAKWYKDPTAKIQLSPRLGIAFPITDRGVIHFSYGHFFQIPNFDILFTNPEYKFGFGTGNLGIAGNPDLKPQQTISGEVGLQQALTDDITFDLTGYFRDIRNLAGTRADEIRIFGGTSTYSQFVNSDFGFVKGIVFTLTKRLSNNWSATVDYTFQSAKGNASDPAATRNAIAGGAQPEIQLVRLDWDQTHTVNATFSYTSEADWGFSLIASYGSGFPYTPTQSFNLSALLTNSELKPSSFNVDLRAYKDIQLGFMKISFFTRVYNLFDIQNQVNVYNDSGTADFTIDEYLRRREGNPELVNTLDEFYRNPTFYSEPRRIEVGATLFF